ncbi:hypothetical protein X925_00175 [Petrotoga sp. 9T1HF07.CasAA.8.2]|nr:hypothetical protein X925_00175 [Petrotoga sp. 9T1HF07.CasAA.8.2]PNR93331.1 hypothetical protein X926_03545 [Petrotoga sp. HWHPT.55.6.3]
MLESNIVNEKTKSQPKETYESLNMVKLREETPQRGSRK